MTPRHPGWWALVLAAAVLAGCGGGGEAQPQAVRPSPPAPQLQAETPLSDTAALGEKIFRDATLSPTGRMACASCHDPARAHAPPNALAVQLGGSAGDRPGLRAVPSLRYLAFVPGFELRAGVRPRGGYDRDGRAATLAQQAEHPLLDASEMAGGSKPAVVGRLRQAAYAAQFREVFGAGILDDADRAFAALTHALQQYQLQDRTFQRFDADYDLFLAGRASLGPAEQRGMDLFNDPAKGNCAACHSSRPGADGTPALFTDFGFAALGVPRNRGLPANADPRFFDLGLCGPLRTDLADQPQLCGAFRTPSLRNVATRQVFFHNGAVAGLREAVRFHVRRDTHPKEWYPPGQDGAPASFDDIPAARRGGVETRPPFDRRPGMAPALSDDEVDDVVRFLGTLTDADQAVRQ